MNQHKNPKVLARAIGLASDFVTAVNYEDQSTWVIHTKRNIYFLADANGFFEWQDPIGEFTGETKSTSTEFVARAFAIWLSQIEGD